MNRIRVWFVRTALDAIGGAEQIIAKVMRDLPKDQFDVTAIWLYEPGVYGEQLQSEGIQTFARLGTSRFDPRLPLRLIRLARQESPDIIFTTENALACFWSGMLKRLRLAPTLVIGFHTTRLERFNSRLAVRFAAPVADRLIALTETHRQYWQKQTKCSGEKFVVIPNGVDTDYFCPPPNRQVVRQQLGLPEKGCIIGLVAYFKPVKNLSLFVDVASRVIARHPDVHFTLVGDGPERPLLVQDIMQRGLTQHFTLPGVCEDPRHWYQAFDILLLTSRSEALPLAILEANSCGVPAVSTDVGGVRDVITHGETGFIAPPENAELLTRWVCYLMENPDRRVQMGMSARQRVIEQFSLHATVDRYTDLFRQLWQESAEKRRIRNRVNP